MPLTELSGELLNRIFESLDDLRSANSFLRTCRAYYSFFNYRLYERGCATHESEVLVWAVHKQQPASVRKFLEYFPPSKVDNPERFYALAIFRALDSGHEGNIRVLLGVVNPNLWRF